MKKINLLALCAIVVSSVMLISCGGNSTPKASLNNDVDSISYAYGVTLAEQGLVQHLEQLGVLESTTDLEYEYQMKISAADSTEKEVLQKELKSKMDSLNKENAPKLDAFLKGVREAINAGKSKSPYIQGLSIGNQLSEHMLPQFTSIIFASDSTKEMNTNQLISGMFGTLRKQNLAISTMDAEMLVQNKMEMAQEESKLKQEEELKVDYKDEIEAGEKFLAENAEREEVVVLSSGLQYEVIKNGTGEIPTDNDQVKVHYHGTLLDGTVFDSSIERKEPAVFGVNQVISGWTEALKLMPVGSKWKVYVPYDLAYGAQDRGTIKPFSTLIFEVELLAIEK